MSRKPLIVWDLDDVLLPFTEWWFADYCRMEKPDCSLEYAGLTENPPHRVLGISIGTFLRSIDRFRISDAAAEIPPHPEVYDWFAGSGDRFRHFILTARPADMVEPARRWSNRNLGKWIEGFDFVPVRAPGQTTINHFPSKVRYIRENLPDCVCFIDDNEKTVEEVSRLSGIQALLFPQPWNSAGRNCVSPGKLMSGISHD